MKRVRSTDYHDYVIKEGRFIGEFEEMYQNCADPWHQDGTPQLAEDIALLLLSGRRYQRILDIGCGRGRFTGRLHAATGAAVTALDISRTAIRAARTKFPGIEFQVAVIPPLSGFADESFDLVVSAELLWYVLPKLSMLFEEVKRVLRPGGHYMIVQKFYQAGGQTYGNDVMQTPDDLIAMLPFSLVGQIDVDRRTNHRFVALVAKNS